ncbi:MAG: alpha-galactosidase, partial [Eubacterium sp.]|nr:alpha-galactosidase [Eubacterium sp.]
MFKLESKRLKREFKIANNTFYASQIHNKLSDMNFVPDGNSSEFVIYFEDGAQFSSKRLPVINSSEENGRLSFTFAEHMGVEVTVEYWVHADGNSICKQLTVKQQEGVAIKALLLENVGIVNSKTHFGVDIIEDSEIPPYQAMLGQPFFIDSLFFGCEFPATDNRILHGRGQIKYFLPLSKDERIIKCPITVMGAADDNTLVSVKKAFFEYIDFISLPRNLRFNFNGWFDSMGKIDEEGTKALFTSVYENLKSHNAPEIASYVIDDGWQSNKAKFWQVNSKKFPNELKDISALCAAFGSGFGLWLSPRGGYSRCKKFGKKIQSGGNGFYDAQSDAICVGSKKYIDNLTEFLLDKMKELSINYLKLDGFSLNPCKNEKHDHLVGGDNDMYFTTEMWHNWIGLFEKLREANGDLFINMTCYVNPSPWWLQWVNSIWLQNSFDIGFESIEEINADDEVNAVEEEISYRDARYYDCIIRRASALPLNAVFNHEPIVEKKTFGSDKQSDESFRKYLIWCAIRGQALNELYISPSLMNDEKWDALSTVMKFQKENFHILKNASFIGGNPEENNIYGFVSFTEEGEGIVALRNPTDEKTPLTLTFNKLMGISEKFQNNRCYPIYLSSEL